MPSETTVLLPPPAHARGCSSSSVSSLSPGAGLEKPLPRASFADFFKAMVPIALVAFGGPQAHVGLLMNRFVVGERAAREYYAVHGKPRVSLSESTFLELYALCQSLPGSGSAQLAVALGAIFGGLPGAVATLVLWHAIGVVVMTGAGVMFHGAAAAAGSGAAVQSATEFTLGLVSAAFALVLLAAEKIVRKAVRGERVKTCVCIFTTATLVLVPPEDASWVSGLLLLFGGSVAVAQEHVTAPRRVSAFERFCSEESMTPIEDAEDTQELWECGIHPALGGVLISAFLTTTAYFVAAPNGDLPHRLAKVFWTIGATVFGGGVIVIPLLLSQIVQTGLLPSSVFLAGFGLFGCVPGPMFNLAPFIGAAIDSWRGAAIATFCLFMPGIAILLGVLPFWQQLRRRPVVQTFVKGVNSVAAGLILAGVWMLMRKALTGPAAYVLTLSSAAGFIVFDSPAPVNILLHGFVGAVLVAFRVGGPFV